jgi:hypothetical protein
MRQMRATMESVNFMRRREPQQHGGNFIAKLGRLRGRIRSR